MIRIISCLLAIAVVAGCSDPVNPGPDDSSDDDRKDPKQGYTSARPPVPEPPAGLRVP